MEDTKLKEEIDTLIDGLRPYFATAALKTGFSYTGSIAKDRDELERFHDYLRECDKALHAGEKPSLPTLMDLGKTFADLSRGTTISMEELLSIKDLLSYSRDIRNFFFDRHDYFRLSEDSYRIKTVDNLQRDLERSLSEDLTVADTASGKLHDIRTELGKVERELSLAMENAMRRYSRYLASESVTLKGGDEALPVKTSDKGFVKGTVVGYSTTRETVYMVPYEVIDLRNKFTNLKEDESEEILRILSDLSKECAENLSALETDYDVIETFDRFFASAQYGQSYDGTIASLSENELTLKGFFHPLLKSDHVVSNDLFLGKDKPKVLLIAGPNAGGKSVLIRAVGLSVLMDRVGLFVPAHEEAVVPFIDEVYYLGGDNQSVLDNLSTFSSHLLGIKNITDRAGKESLVIIDEVGEGTSPRDGEALGVSLLKFFEKLDSFTLLTSHFDGVKNYALEDEKVLSGAMEFKRETLSPTYRLLLGTTGNSYGLLLAKKMGLRPEILEEARKYQDSLSTRDIDALMEELGQEKSDLDRKMKAVESKTRELDRLIKKREEQIKAINEEKSNIHRKAKEKIDRLVEKRIQDIDRAFKEQSTPKSFSEVSKAKGELNKILKEEEKVPQTKSVPPIVVHPGDAVVDEDNRRGVVIECKKDSCTIDYDGLKIKRKVSGLRLAPKSSKPVKKTYVETVHLDLTPSKGLELNIIGLHVDEAMREVVSFLDSARLRKFGHVRIVHGAGTFALKNAVWKYLQNHPEFIKSYRLGGQGEGGLGATVVELK